MQSSGLKLTTYGICFGTKVVLADVNLTLTTQGVSVLMGPVGTGKSSLLCSLAGINDNNPRFKSWGTAYLNALLVDDKNRPALVRQQLTQLNETVEDAILRQANFSGINLAKRHKYVIELIESFSVHGLVEMLNQRVIDIKPVWQRIAIIIGTAATKPDLLMIDEPTSNLSTHDTQLILDLITNIGKKIKILVVLHSQAQARNLANDIILLAGGRVQFHGEVDAFFEKNPPNDIVKQFTHSGSVSIASPDARKEDLADDAIAPPPLPQAAIDAVKEFSKLQPPQSTENSTAKNKNNNFHIKTDALSGLASSMNTVLTGTNQSKPGDLAVKKSQDFKISDNQSATSPSTLDSQKDLQKTFNSTPAAPTIPLVELPKPSKDGVSIVAGIGKVAIPASRGPKGFSWIVPGMLAGCPMPGVSDPIDYDLDLLVGVGITTLITLTEEDLFQSELNAAGLHNVHLPIYDRKAPTLNQMHMLLLKMQRLLEQGEVLAVHCLAGIGRTGTVLAAWMIKEGGLSAEEAIRRLRLINPSFVQSEEQELFLVEFENDILKRMR